MYRPSSPGVRSPDPQSKCPKRREREGKRKKEEDRERNSEQNATPALMGRSRI